MEIDSQYRVEYLTFEKNGTKSLPKLPTKYFDREKKISDLYDLYDHDMITDLQLVERISKLFIPEKFYLQIDDILGNMDDLTDVETENYIDSIVINILNTDI